MRPHRDDVKRIMISRRERPSEIHVASDHTRCNRQRKRAALHDFINLPIPNYVILYTKYHSQSLKRYHHSRSLKPSTLSYRLKMEHNGIFFMPWDSCIIMENYTINAMYRDEINHEMFRKYVKDSSWITSMKLKWRAQPQDLQHNLHDFVNVSHLG